MLYVLLCGYPPFCDETDADVLAKVWLGNFTFNAAAWKNVSDDAKDFSKKLLKMAPRDRPIAEQALAHVWAKYQKPQSCAFPRAVCVSS